MGKIEDRTAVLSKYNLVFPTALKPEAIVMYADILDDIEANELDAILKKISRTNTFFPSVAEIINAHESMDGDANGTHVKSIGEAWQEVLKEMHDAFVYRKPEFSSEEIKNAAMGMGWMELCQTLESDLPTVRAQFERRYKDELTRKKDREQNEHVLGEKKNKQLFANKVKEIGHA